MALNNWPPTKLEKRHQILTDTVHGTINLYHPIETLVDSKVSIFFMTLADLKDCQVPQDPNLGQMVI